MKKQYYRKIEGNKETLDIKTRKFNFQIDAIKVNDYENAYVSINSLIKPKALHLIVKTQDKQSNLIK